MKPHSNVQSRPNAFREQLPIITACIILAALPMYYWRFRVGGIPTNVLELAILLLGLLMVTSSWRCRIRLFPYWQGALLVLLGITMSSIIAREKDVALGILKGWFIVPIIFAWLLTTLIVRRTLPLFTGALLANALFVSLYAILQRQGIIPLVEHQQTGGLLSQYVLQGRALGFFESPNFLAMYLIPLTVFLSIWHAADRRILPLITVPFIAIFLSGSRAGLLTILILGFAVFLYLLWKKGKAYLASGAVVAIAFLVVYLTSSVNLAGVDSLRFGIWRVALHLITDHPIFGIGAGQFLDYFKETTILPQAIYEGALPYALHPHNLYLAIWLSGGILAVSGFIVLLAGGMRNFRLGLQHHTKLALAAGGALASIFIHGLIDTTYFKNDLSVLFWVFMIFLWYARQSPEK